jgi:glycosyltransferase involved in cell wall biosynthesis
MLLCRPFFKRVILHWHAAGLAKWLETCVQIRSRSITFDLMKHVDLSIVLSRYNRADAEKLFPQRIKIISNGIPDPCPAFEQEILPRRKARLAAREKLMAGGKLSDDERKAAGAEPQTYRILYLAHCTRGKGVFDAIAGVKLANEILARQKSPITLRLTIAGNFVNHEEKLEFEKLIEEPGMARTVRYLGFVGGDQKNQALRDADLFCFPTYYQNENQPVNLIEAMAFGLPIITTRWRSLPEMFLENYPGLVEIRAPDRIAAALLALMTMETGEAFRDNFCKSFALTSYLNELAAAFHSTEQNEPSNERAVVPAA